jgi:hypothetical protein
MEILEWLSIFAASHKRERLGFKNLKLSTYIQFIYLNMLTHHMGTFCKCRIEKETPTKSFELKLVSS